ncbi:hypothetical protein [Coleofasciculus sp. H7-2]|uniref:hypothetical protein n=1 Tax=Coleofasciculus sp. H7-2 TaxID=3351545 RepID=UPI00366CE541
MNHDEFPSVEIERITSVICDVQFPGDVCWWRGWVDFLELHLASTGYPPASTPASQYIRQSVHPPAITPASQYIRQPVHPPGV